MVFSSVLFLFLFLPLVLLGNAFTPKNLRNTFLLIASLLFYFWGETDLIGIILFSILINYSGGLLIDKARSYRKAILLITVSINFLVLIYYKYFFFLIDNLNGFIGLDSSTMQEIKGIRLPMGISFFTFQGVSYVVDVYRKHAKAQINPINIGLYISLFPQLIAGPIVRYNSVMDQIKNRVTTLDYVYEGISRFIKGFCKKILIANTMAQVADGVFEANLQDVSTPQAWLGIICYSLQILFDFSGYSDMAIGLGKMLGFDFEENFNYPYISKSIKEFWRRWHISLSTWFRDYLYIPLGGNRKGKIRNYINLLIVFLATGIWHGASWSFMFWGLFHGLFLIFERLGFEKLLSKLFKPLQHIYVLLVVIVGWVFFRVEVFTDALYYLKIMFGAGAKVDFHWWDYMNSYNTLTLFLGVLFSINFIPALKKWESRILVPFFRPYLKFRSAIVLLTLLFIFYFSISEIANSTYNPFIYFRF